MYTRSLLLAGLTALTISDAASAQSYSVTVHGHGGATSLAVVSRTVRSGDSVPAGQSARSSAGFSAPLAQPSRPAILQLGASHKPVFAMPTGRPSGSVPSGRSSASQALGSRVAIRPLTAVPSSMSSQPMPLPSPASGVFSRSAQPAATSAPARNALAAPASQPSSLPVQPSSTSASESQAPRTPAVATSVPAPRASGASAATTTRAPSSQPSSLSTQSLPRTPAPAAASPTTPNDAVCDAHPAQGRQIIYSTASSCSPRNRMTSSGQ
jgi:hypothetical protein